MSWKPYPGYRATGAAWLPEVPEDWAVVALRWLSRRYAGGTPDRSNSAYWEDGDIPWLNSGAVNDRYITEPSEFITREGYLGSSAKWVPKGALVMALAGQGKTKGMVARLGIDATCNQSMAAIVPNRRIEARYLYWWLTSNYFNVRNMAGGEARDGLNLELLGDIACPVPSGDEQQAIADFLDRETANIDTLVAKKRALIERLKEKRSALISHAVTKGLPLEAARAAGLDPYPRLKPSGIDWLPDVPKHWETVKLRRRAKRIQTGTTPPTSEERYYEEGTLPWYGPGSFDDNVVLARPVKMLNFSALEDGFARIFAPGATLVVTIGATLGKVSSLRKPGSCNQQITGIEFAPTVHARFATYQLKRLEVMLRSIAPSATLPILDQEEIADLWLMLPTIEEQLAIASFLDRMTASADHMIERIDSAIERVQEYRTALIIAAVTGQIDVRTGGK